MVIIAELGLWDLIGTFLGFVFTLIVFSYAFGDNAFFRFTIFIFIGIASGYATIVSLYSVIFPRLILPLFSDNRAEQLLGLVPLGLSAFLLMKISPRMASWGTPATALLVGIAAATAIGGAILGTLFPQVGATINLFDLAAIRDIGGNLAAQLMNGLVILIGTISSLAFFHFGVRSNSQLTSQRYPWIDSLGQVGEVFIAITLGALFAGVYIAAMIALIQRIQFLVEFVSMLINPFIAF
jgi:hypothetical protein